MQICGRRGFQTEGTARAKAPRQEHAGGILDKARRVVAGARRSRETIDEVREVAVEVWAGAKGMSDLLGPRRPLEGH